MSGNGSLSLNVVRCLAILASILFLTACATDPRVVEHSFGFDIRKSIPRVEVIDYRYGESKLPVRAPEWAVKEGRPLYFNGVSGAMRIGDYLYVQWRIVDTGQVFEETIDLRQRLPRDIKDHKVHFDIQGPQLYVYLITPDPRPIDAPPNGPRMYHYRKVITLYPDQPKH